MAEAAFPAGRLAQLLDQFKLHLRYELKDHLRDALIPFDGERLLSQVDEQHLDLPAVVGIDRARSIESGDPMLQRLAAARPDLRFKLSGHSDGDAGGN